ncbi:MAG: tellurite resistance TerB family protein [Rhodobiaceae bacterium]|nr:tellurite resistance TerB family protein [Rhodobiaceae bacterium]
MSQMISHHHALIYVMVTMSAVDRSMDEIETHRIGQIVQTLPVFADFNEDEVVHAARNCAAILQEDEGLDTILAMVADALPQKLYETAYALAVDVAAANLTVEQEELRFLQMLRDRLNLDKLAVAAIERGARARHKTL